VDMDISMNIHGKSVDMDMDSLRIGNFISTASLTAAQCAAVSIAHVSQLAATSEIVKRF